MSPVASAWPLPPLDAGGFGETPTAALPSPTFLPPLRRPAGPVHHLPHSGTLRPALYSSLRLPGGTLRPEPLDGLVGDGGGASTGYRAADVIDPVSCVTPPFTPANTMPRPPVSSWRAERWQSGRVPVADVYAPVTAYPPPMRSWRDSPSAFGGSSTKRLVAEPAEHVPSWHHLPSTSPDRASPAPQPQPHLAVPLPPPPYHPMAVKPLWQPELQMVLPKAVGSPAPVFTTRVPVGHDSAVLRRPAASALPPPPVVDRARQQRQEQELVELLSSQGDTEQLPVPPVVDVCPRAPPPRFVRQPWWSNPRTSFDVHPVPPVALGLPTMSTTTFGGSAHKNHELKPTSNPASGVLGVASFLTAPGMGGGCSSVTSSRRVYSDDSCAVDSMRQHSSSADRHSSAGSRPVATVSTPLSQPPAPASFRLPRARVTWTPDLRRRFDKAVERVGGIRVATPTTVLEAMTASADAEGVMLPLTRGSVASYLQRQRKRCRDAAAADAAAALAHGAAGSVGGFVGQRMVDVTAARPLQGCSSPLRPGTAPWA